MSVADLMEDRVTLDGVLMKCNQNPAKARTDSDCLNARIAIERLASQSDPAEEAKRTEEFERSRDKLRRPKTNSDRNRKRKPKWTPITCRWFRSSRRRRPRPAMRVRRPQPARPSLRASGTRSYRVRDEQDVGERRSLAHGPGFTVEAAVAQHSFPLGHTAAVLRHQGVAP